MTRPFFILTTLVFGTNFLCSAALAQKPTVKQVLSRYVAAIGTPMKMSTKINLVIEERAVRESKKETHKQSISHYLVGDKQLIVEGKGKREWFLGGQPWSDFSKGRARNQMPVHYRHPIEWPLFISEYPSELRYSEATIDDPKLFRIVADPLFDDPEPFNNSPMQFDFGRKDYLLKTVHYSYKTMHFSDYRKVDGLLIPHQIVIDFTSPRVQKLTLTISKIDSKANINLKRFEIPESYKNK